jgi:hypothetical protein
MHTLSCLLILSRFSWINAILYTYDSKMQGFLAASSGSGSDIRVSVSSTGSADVVQAGEPVKANGHASSRPSDTAKGPLDADSPSLEAKDEPLKGGAKGDIKSFFLDIDDNEEPDMASSSSNSGQHEGGEAVDSKDEREGEGAFVEEGENARK